jgi:hypothetical protein
MKIDKENKIVYLPYTTPAYIIKAWNDKGYKVQLEIE